MEAITMHVLEMKRRRKDLVRRLAPLAERAHLTREEEKAYEDIRGQLEALGKEIEELEPREGTGPRTHLASLKDRAAKAARPRVANPGFQNVGELLYCARFEPRDSRVLALQEMGTGAAGGIPVPDDLDPVPVEVRPQDAIFRPRATVVPAGDSPDADLVVPSLNQGSAANMYGGVAVDWIGEGVEKPETQMQMKESRWSPKEVAAHIVVTDKLLRNWKASSSLIDRMLRGAILAAEDAAFLKGNGVGRPLGVLASDALKKVSRAQAGTVTYTDLLAMEAEFLDDPSAVWIVTPRAIQHLREMKDSEGRYIWVPLARNLPATTLLGRPVIKNYRSPALGTLGDIALVAPPYYLIKDGTALTVAASEHVLFKQNKTVVKAFKSVDGAPWLGEPIVNEDGQSYSPFVALDVPA
jgi:HK97 family phage major capsid protein